ncbi:hypothetical protein CYMTET_43015 [Cymbomonas tetramitiformis]|uniref:Peptidase C1A papain C-terminal domain-containing protein n=1 Tax=Cymbomonas tetramitiformis TaxID=36881 RepID=A0AAE0C4N2_9CHLO|nr:hypothetical protein CYMTET_43015 [Cymbomonas tetramitiformis]
MASYCVFLILALASVGLCLEAPEAAYDETFFSRLAPGQLQRERATMRETLGQYPFKTFPQEYVQKALSSGIDWRPIAVTPAKNQGGHGYCGTFGRVAAAEGQYAIRSGYFKRNFSEEQLIDCVGWDLNQLPMILDTGFMSSEDYPYNTTGPDMDPPIPYNPCRLNTSKIIPGSKLFTNTTAVPPSAGEDQFAAFIFHNGPSQAGINADVFGERAKGCEATLNCFITRDMCEMHAGKSIDHSVTIVGFGVDKEHGEYWEIKNSWSTAFANNGFIKIARGVNCGNLAKDAAIDLFTIGDPSSYYV